MSDLATQENFAGGLLFFGGLGLVVLLAFAYALLEGWRSGAFKQQWRLLLKRLRN